MPVFMFPEKELTKEEMDNIIHKVKFQHQIYEKLCEVQQMLNAILKKGGEYE